MTNTAPHHDRRRTLGLLPTIAIWEVFMILACVGVIIGAMLWWDNVTAQARNADTSSFYTNVWEELETSWAKEAHDAAATLLIEPGVLDAIRDEDRDDLVSMFSTRYNFTATDIHLNDWELFTAEGLPWLSFADPNRPREGATFSIGDRSILDIHRGKLVRNDHGDPVWITPVAGADGARIGWMALRGALDHIATEYQSLVGMGIVVIEAGEPMQYLADATNPMIQNIPTNTDLFTCVETPSRPHRYLHVHRAQIGPDLAVQILVDATSLHHRITTARWMAGSVTAGALVLFMVFGLYNLRRRILPIYELRNVMIDAESTANFDVRAPVRRADEVGQLAVSFNALTDKIRADINARKETEERLSDYMSDLIEVRDAAERHAQELAVKTIQLEDAQRQAESASHTKSAFLANMSHEIRTPMTAILGYTELLLDPTQAPDERARSIETIRRNGEHLLSLINDILDLSKIEAGQMTVERIQTNPFIVAAEIESLMRAKAREKGISLGVEVRTPIPERVTTDPTRLRQILVNLIGNAVKFTDEGGVRMLISFQPPTTLHIEVLDTGPGMTPEQLQRIFEAFQQADTSVTRKHGGTGLGLAISRRLAAALGGEISVRSTPGEGSAFTVTIDTGDVAGVALRTGDELRVFSTEQANAGAQARSVDLTGVRILLAEDGPDNQRLISHHLRKVGAEVTIVDNGAKALEQFAATHDSREPFHLVLMDMQMPVMDGYTAASELRHRGFTVPVIALTAHAMTGDRSKCLRAGCNDYATKPIRKDDLLEICARAVEHPHNNAAAA